MAGLDPRSVAVFERSAEGRGGGAGVVTDDLSVAFLKGMGALSAEDATRRVNPMRVQEERVGCSGHRLARDEDFPCFSAYWADVHVALKECLPEGVVRWGKELRDYSQPARPGDGEVLLTFADGETVSCELLVGADGPSSGVRSKADPPPPGWCGDMRYAGYYAWRGILPRASCPPDAFQQLKEQFVDYGNCLYFIVSNSRPRQHAVLYELGGELINWLIYVSSDSPVCGGKATMAAPPALLARLFEQIEAAYGPAFAAIVRATPDPFLNDIFDREPLSTLIDRRVLLLGDSAHPVTPHAGKGSNMAMHDALALGQSFATVWETVSAPSPALAAAWMKQQPERADLGWRLGAAVELYNSRRVDEVRRVVLASRHYGRLRNRLMPEAALLAVGGKEWEDVSEAAYEAAVRATGLQRPLQGQLMPADPMMQLAPL